MSNQTQWHLISVEESVKQVGAHPQTGLSSAEVTSRLEKYGKNELQ